MLFDPRHSRDGSIGLRLDGLVYRAGHRTLLNGITAQLSARQLTVVLGPNGAGKSLTLRAIQGLIDCETGDVSVLRDDAASQPVASLHCKQGGVGLVFQKPMMFRRTVRANLIHALFIIVQSTTSTQNSGLFDHILPMFTEKTGVEVRVVAVGTGQAIKNAANGDGDVLFVHAKSAEEKFVAEGDGVERAT
jgi:ABC-type branched-subunit amino acid transport system ATPase component